MSSYYAYLAMLNTFVIDISLQKIKVRHLIMFQTDMLPKVDTLVWVPFTMTPYDWHDPITDCEASVW